MDRRTFLKAVGAGVAGVMLPAVPGTDKDKPLTFRGVPISYVPNLAGQSADYVIFTSTPSGNNPFYDRCVIQGQSSPTATRGDRAKKVYFRGVELPYEPVLCRAFGKGKSYEKTLLIYTEKRNG